MQTRYERKYILTHNQYLLFKELITFSLPHDKFQSQEYPVMSLYYDDEALSFFYDKINGEFSHIKLRIRQYKDCFHWNTPCWVELKMKEGDTQLKKRIFYSAGIDHNFLEYQNYLKLLRNNTFNPYTKLRPQCWIHFHREAFETLYSNYRLRITFDRNIKSLPYWNKSCELDQFNNLIFDNSGEDQVVLEVKYDLEQLPNFMLKLLSQIGCEEKSFSKYAAGLQLLYDLNT